MGRPDLPQPPSGPPQARPLPTQRRAPRFRRAGRTLAFVAIPVVLMGQCGPSCTPALPPPPPAPATPAFDTDTGGNCQEWREGTGLIRATAFGNPRPTRTVITMLDKNNGNTPIFVEDSELNGDYAEVPTERLNIIAKAHNMPAPARVRLVAYSVNVGEDRQETRSAGQSECMFSVTLAA